jgi:hypothetical protein
VSGLAGHIDLGTVNWFFTRCSYGTISESNLNPDGWRYLLQKLKINKFLVPLSSADQMA